MSMEAQSLTIKSGIVLEPIGVTLSDIVLAVYNKFVLVIWIIFIGLVYEKWPLKCLAGEGCR